MQDLEGRVAIVTGGASGLGSSVAMLLAARGSSVVVADVAAEGVASLVDRIGKSAGVAVGAECDVSEQADVERLANDTIRRFGRIDILVNNAGVNATGDSEVASVTVEEWDRVFRVNARGVLLCTQAVVPCMVKQGGGSVVIVSSNGALYGSDGGHAYRASKAAVLSLTRTFAIELAARNVRVNAVCPGAMDTEMRRLAALERPVVAPETVPLGRIADPDEVARCVVFLASEQASYVTGAILVVDGGRVAK